MGSDNDMKYKSIEINAFKMFMESLWTTMFIVCIPGNIFLLVISHTITNTIIHSIMLMYFTSVLTVKVFGWRIKKDNAK